MGTRVKQGSETTQYFYDIAAAFLEREGVTYERITGIRRTEKSVSDPRSSASVDSPTIVGWSQLR